MGKSRANALKLRVALRLVRQGQALLDVWNSRGIDQIGVIENHFHMFKLAKKFYGRALEAVFGVMRNQAVFQDRIFGAGKETPSQKAVVTADRHSDENLHLRSAPIGISTLRNKS